jgi:protein arginine N-methyltransferase 3
MVPSQTRLVISAITGAGVWKDKVAFWDDVYGQCSLCLSARETDGPGFDMTVMKPTYFEEGLVEIVDAKEVVTDEYVVKVSLIA